MKLFYTPTSPFVRKVRIAAIEKGLDEKIELVLSPPRENSPALHSANPLGKIPALELENDQSIFDSSVICEYLDSLSEQGHLFPSDTAERLRARQMEALANGIMEALVARFLELARPENERSPGWIERWESAISRSLSALEDQIDALPETIDIGHVSLGAALGYMNLRYPECQWQAQCPKTAAWFEAFSKRPSMQETPPST